jgi:RimJ/RimL family protein N-acetyltransferase
MSNKSSIPPFEHMPPAEFDTPDSKIHLRLFNHGDEEDLLRLVQDENVQKYVPWAKRIHDLESARETIDNFTSSWERQVMARYVIDIDGNFAGYTGLWTDKQPNYYEFGFAVFPELRGQGIGKKVVAEVINIAKTKLQAKGMVAYVDDSNDASKAVVVSFGFSPTDEFDKGDRRYELEFNS